MPIAPLTRVPKGTVIKLSITLPGKQFDGLALTFETQLTPAQAARDLQRRLVPRFIDQFLPHEEDDA